MAMFSELKKSLKKNDDVEKEVEQPKTAEPQEKDNGSWIGSNPKYNFADAGKSTDYGTYENDLNNFKEAQKKYQIQQLKSARDTALNNLNAQEQNIKPAYQNARNMTSANSQQGARSFAEYMANRGLTNSGASAQGEMNRLSTLQNNLGNINTQEANAYRDIANQRTQVENSYANGIASANAQIEADYLNNLLNYNEQQRQMREQLLQNSVKQYADDYQARLNQLKAEGKEGTLEYAMTEAARGNKVENNNANAYNYPVSMSKIQSGNWNYNDLLATGMTQQQAQQTYQDYQATLQAQAEKQAYEDYMKRVELENATKLNNANIANKNASTANYYDQINKRGTVSEVKDSTPVSYSTHKSIIDKNYSLYDTYDKEFLGYDLQGIIDYVSNEMASGRLNKTDATSLFNYYGIPVIED